MSKAALKELLRAETKTFERMSQIIPEFERRKILTILRGQVEILEKLR